MTPTPEPTKPPKTRWELTMEALAHMAQDPQETPERRQKARKAHDEEMARVHRDRDQKTAAATFLAPSSYRTRSQEVGS